MAVGFSNTNKPINPRGLDASPKGYNRAALYSGKALDFDGVNDEINTTYTSGFTGAQEFTYCAYVKADTNTSDQAIIHADENTGWGLQSLHIRSDFNGFRFFAGTGSSSTSYVDSEAIETGKWYFVVGTHTPTENKIYINGVLNATATADNLTTAPASINIGRYTTGQLSYNGQISNAKVFDVALTAAQVADLYNNPEKIVPTGVAESALKLWLPMMEGAGTTCYDGSGGGNHGTISGATWTHGIGSPVAQTAVIDWNKGTNGITYSEQLDNADWIKGSFLAVTADQTTSPSGTSTADLSTNSGTTNVFLYQLSANSALTWTASLFAKKGTNKNVGISICAQSYVNSRYQPVFDLSDGTLLEENTTGSNMTNTSYDIEALADGWYRISATGTFVAGADRCYIVFQHTNSDTITKTTSGSLDWTNATNGTAYYWGAQLNAGSVGPYMPTIGTTQTSDVLLPQGLTSGRDITGVNLFENVRKQGALNLDGNSWAEVHDNGSLDITDAITLEAWVYWDDSSAKGILGRYMTSTSERSYLLYKANKNVFGIFVSSDGTGANSDYEYNTTNISDGWNHLVGIYDGSNLQLYLNGSADGSKSTTIASLYANDEPIEIGRYKQSLTESYPNQIAQPRIYNRALTAEEVQRNYDSNRALYK